MARVFEISFKLGAQLAGSFAKTMQGASSSLSQLNNRIGELNKAEHATQSLISLRKTVLDSTRAYRDARQKVADLGREISSTDKPSKEMIRNFERAEKEVNKAKNTLISQREQLKQLNTTMGTTGTSTRELIKRQDQLAQAADRARSAQSSLNKTMAAQQANMAKRGELRGQLFDAAAMAASLAAPIMAAARFESAMADVNKVVDQTDAQAKEMSSTIVDMSRRIPIAADGLAQIVAAGGQSGIARDQLALFAESAAQMGVAFDISAGNAGEMMAKWRTAFGLGQSGVVALADQINYLSNTSAASAPLISDVVTRVGGLGKIAGLNSGEVAALGSALIAVGTPSEVAATGLQNMFLAMTAGRSATKAQQQAFAQLGFEAQDMASMMQNDAQGAIIALLDSVKQLSNEERPAVLTEIFGKESIKSIGQLLNNADELAKNFKSVGDQSKYSGSMLKEFQTRSATTENNMTLLRNRVNALGISLGNILLPGVNSVVSGLGWMADTVANLASSFPFATKVIVGATAALIALRVTTIAGAYAFTFIKGAWLQGVAVLKTLRVAYLLTTGATIASTNASKAAIVVSKAMTAAQWLFNAAMSANPIGLAIVAIAALVAAGIALYKNWDTVVAFFGSAWERMKSMFLNFTPLGWMISGFSALTNWLSNFSLYDSGAKLLSTLASGIKSAISVPVDAIKGALSKVREYLPFSDAKVGPLSELTASGQAILNTIGDGMGKVNVAGMMTPLAGMGAAVDSLVPGKRDTMDAASGRITKASQAGGGITLQLTQNITLGSGVGAEAASQAREGAAAGANDMLTALKQAMDQERRLSYD